MTSGTMIFGIGIGMLIAALLLGLIFLITLPGSKKKIQEKMNEKY